MKIHQQICPHVFISLLTSSTLSFVQQKIVKKSVNKYLILYVYVRTSTESSQFPEHSQFPNFSSPPLLQIAHVFAGMCFTVWTPGRVGARVTVIGTLPQSQEGDVGSLGPDTEIHVRPPTPKTAFQDGILEGGGQLSAVRSQSKAKGAAAAARAPFNRYDHLFVFQISICKFWFTFFRSFFLEPFSFFFFKFSLK